MKITWHSRVLVSTQDRAPMENVADFPVPVFFRFCFGKNKVRAKKKTVT